MAMQDRAELERFQLVLDSRGADQARWPSAERAGFEALLARSPEARRRLAEAAALDRLLELAPATTATRPLELAARIQHAARAGTEAAPRVSMSRQRSQLGWAGGALVAASIAAGVFLGSLSAVSGWIDPLLGNDSEVTSVFDSDLVDEGDVL